MVTRITKHDIGAEIISILTRGMYPDPRDALREYAQNGIDAGATSITIKVRGNSIVVEDDGTGMDESTMRKAIRIGISDKNPKVDVGFRGIGIYSAFHLCDQLFVFSRSKNNGVPHSLMLNFKEMKDILSQQQASRLEGNLSGDELMDLQSLLEKHIEFKVLKIDDFPVTGTRVEMVNLDPNFFKSLSKFSDVSEYLQQVVPLHFNKDKFKWGTLIEKKILRICEEHGQEFKAVDLTLQVNTQIEKLFRPYKDEDFDTEPLEPFFNDVKRSGHFFGVAWGCLNSARRKIRDKELRGLLIKKQGFAIGKRVNIAKYFGRTTFFDRYIGEIITVHPDLLPNAPRTDFEVSPLRTLFYEALSDTARYFNEKANLHQEYTKGDEELDKAINRLKEIEANFAFFSDNTEQLIDIIVELRNMEDQIKGRLDRKVLRLERREDASKIVNAIKTLEKEIQRLIDKSRGKIKALQKGMTPEIKSLERIKKLPRVEGLESSEKPPASLAEIANELDITVSKEIETILDYIDERFIQSLATNNAEYASILKSIKEELETLLSEE